MSVHAMSNERKLYMVVFNMEEQYSIWPVQRRIPLGWTPAGKRGSKSECLDYIEEVWTDITPLRLRSHFQVADKQKVNFICG